VTRAAEGRVLRVPEFVRRARTFYLTQARLLWRWRGGRRALVKHALVTVAVSVISLFVTAAVAPGFTVDSLGAAGLMVVVMAGFNGVIRPVLLAAVIPFSLVLTGVLVVGLQIAAFLLGASVVGGIHVDGVVSAAVASTLYAVVDSTLSSVIGVDRGPSFFGSLVQALWAQSPGSTIRTPGLVIIQIDGLAHAVLLNRIRAGSVTNMSGWVRSGSHRLSRWEVLLPSMTSSSQLGILHGSNDEVPAFRWFERDRQRTVVSSNPKDAAMLVARHSNGGGLLSNDGVSIDNLVTGDATRSYVTTASLAGPTPLGDRRAFWGLLLSPTGYVHVITLFVGELVKERIQSWRARRAGVTPRLDRGLTYAVMRAASNVLLRDMNTALIIEEMYRGANVIYADFTDYDEIAHHSGPERAEALDALDGIDRAIGTLTAATADIPRPYRFIVLSDHGQTLGATFRQRYGETLGDVVQRLIGGDVEFGDSREPETFVDTFLSDLVRAQGATAAVARRVLASRTRDGVVTLGRRAADTVERHAVVLGSGNLGLVYLRGTTDRVSFEALESAYPRLIRGLVDHPGVGLVLVHSATQGGIVLGRYGAVYLVDGRVEGVDPLQGYPGHALDGLRREDAMRNAPDVLVISDYSPDLNEVAAFEELIGSHGGIGGPQTDAFILHPSDMSLGEDVPIGSQAIHKILRRWLEELGVPVGSA
jgi:uncharacterized membrane protein YvlD (DUF360 family)